MPDPDHASTDHLADLGVRLVDGGGQLRVWSSTASKIELCIFSDRDATWVTRAIPLTKGDHDVWEVTSDLLKPGVRYSLRASGPKAPKNRFDQKLHLIDPYARGLARTKDGDWRGYVQEPDTFDWAGSQKPRIGLDHTVFYEAHVKGISKLNPARARGTARHLRGARAREHDRVPARPGRHDRRAAAHPPVHLASSASSSRVSSTTGVTTR